jgi:hypothetical protein
MRSMNQGDTWEAISPDLTAGGKKGNVPYGTLTTISESPFQFGLLYAGSDDGMVHISKNGGSTWKEIGQNIGLTGLKSAEKLWVAQVLASTHKKERVYVALSGYRYDDFTIYLYKSDDYGTTWKSFASNIPNSSVNVIIEDPENENLLFAGTDNGLYASINQGVSWETFQNEMPNVAIHDLVIQPEAKHLIIATHGRGIYTSNIAPLQLMTPNIVAKDLYVFDLENIKHSSRWGNAWSSWMKANTPGLAITFYSSNPDTIKALVKTDDDIVVSETELKADKGLNVLSFDVAFSKAGKMNYLKKHKAKLEQAKDGKTYLPKGTYTAELAGNGAKEIKTFTIE